MAAKQCSDKAPAEEVEGRCRDVVASSGRSTAMWAALGHHEGRGVVGWAHSEVAGAWSIAGDDVVVVVDDVDVVVVVVGAVAAAKIAPAVASAGNTGSAGGNDAGAGAEDSGDSGDGAPNRARSTT